MSAELRALAEKAQGEPHVAKSETLSNRAYLARRDFYDAITPDVILALLDERDAAIRRAEALIPLATRMADHLFHPEGHPVIREQEPTDNCWIDLYRAIVGLDDPAALRSQESQKPPADNEEPT